MRSWRGLTAAAILGLVTATAATAAIVAHGVDRRASEERRDEASRAQADLSGQLRLSLDGLASVSGLFASSRDVTRAEFETFSRGLLTDSPLAATLLAKVPSSGERQLHRHRGALARGL